MNVLMASRESSFNMKDYEDSVLKEVDSAIICRLVKRWKDIKDIFIKAYELTPHQLEILREAGVTNPEKYGARGLQPSEWGTFGATVKTMNEFSRSYTRFKKRCIEFIKKISKEE